jgi:putative nucleotidyltransferase with HDIG domain
MSKFAAIIIGLFNQFMLLSINAIKIAIFLAIRKYTILIREKLRGTEMKTNMKGSNLDHEEKRAIKWLLILFYLLFISFDLFYFYLYPKYILNENIEYINNSKFFYYFLIIMLIPLVMRMLRKKDIFSVKYIFFLSYTLITILYDSITYFGSGVEYKNGNIVEVFLLLFAPIFVSSLFYWTVAIGTIFKYTFIGVLLHTSEVFFPVAVIIVLTFVGAIILKRFQGYISAIKTSYDEQLSGIVRGVIATIELKDPYTRGHSERVAFYAKSLAAFTGKYTLDELRSFTYACLLHDIGKVNIPDSILMKPGKLSKEEYDVIKTHPEVGAKAIFKVKGLADSIDIIKSHHERWDGTGYPEQLKGDQIPYLARIVSIADAYDAMTSSRSYRSAMPVDEAYKRIIEGKGTQFDPQLVEIFKEVFPEWKTFQNRYNWSEDLLIPTCIS